MRPIGLYLISGFLGAGKTTFLTHMLTRYTDRKVGVIVNEFGSVSIDGDVLERDGIKLIEINNGSIFCACLKGGFVKTLIGFSKTDIDILFIENSGMADPSSMHTLLEGIVPFVERPLIYKGAVCIVDALNFLEDADMFAPVTNQVAASHMVLVNKTDLASEEHIGSVHKAVSEINPEAVIIDTVQAYVPPEVIEEKLTVSDFCKETTNHPWNRPATYTVTCGRPVKRDDADAFVQKIKSRLIRLKGFVLTEEGYYQINAVGDYVQMAKAVPANISGTTLVMIGRTSEDFDDDIRQLWLQLTGTEIEIEE